jgi:AcrR family transcriptional regulator
MALSEQALGLRDRKKIRTRDTIRREAMRLILADGYANTTIEQIADAADISPSTFFRYFGTKESVLVSNDLDLVTVQALEQQPANLPTLQALRRAIEITMATVSAAEWRQERARLKLVLSVPELKAAQFDEYHRTVAMLAAAEARRIGRDSNDFEVRVVIGAVAGALMAVIEGARDAERRMYRALDFFEANMPLPPNG